jgi:hypothetical protein
VAADGVGRLEIFNLGRNGNVNQEAIRVLFCRTGFRITNIHVAKTGDLSHIILTSRVIRTLPRVYMLVICGREAIHIKDTLYT